MAGIRTIDRGGALRAAFRAIAISIVMQRMSGMPNAVKITIGQ